MANYFDSGTHTLTYLASLNAIARHTGTGDINNVEAVERLRRLTLCAIHRVPVVEITEADRAAAIAAPPEKEA